MLNALNSEDRGLKVRFSLATIAFETFELTLRQMLSLYMQPFTAKIETWTCLTKGSEIAFWEGSVTESAQS